MSLLCRLGRGRHGYMSVGRQDDMSSGDLIRKTLNLGPHPWIWMASPNCICILRTTTPETTQYYRQSSTPNSLTYPRLHTAQLCRCHSALPAPPPWTWPTPAIEARAVLCTSCQSAVSLLPTHAAVYTSANMTRVSAVAFGIPACLFVSSRHTQAHHSRTSLSTKLPFFRFGYTGALSTLRRSRTSSRT